MATCEYEGEFYECTFAEKYILPIYDGLDQSPAADFVKESMVIVPWAGTFHLIAIALLGGAVFMVDMRLLGAGLTTRSPQEINRTVQPLMIAAVLLAMVSGTVLALGELMKLYYSPPYWMKIGSLVAAILFTFGVRNRVLAANGRFSPSAWGLSGISMVVWIGTFIALSNNMARVALLLLIAALATIVWFSHGGKAPAIREGLSLKLVAAASIIMWLTTAAAGRWIAFY